MSDDYSDALAPFSEDYNTLLAFSGVMLAAIIMTLPLLIFCEKGTRDQRQVTPTEEVVVEYEQVEIEDREQQTERKRQEWLDLLNPNPTDGESQVEYPEMEDKGTNSSKPAVDDRVLYKRPAGRESVMSLETIPPSETEMFTQTSQSYNEAQPSPTYPVVPQKPASETTPHRKCRRTSKQHPKKAKSDPQTHADKLSETSDNGEKRPKTRRPTHEMVEDENRKTRRPKNEKMEDGHSKTRRPKYEMVEDEDRKTRRPKNEKMEDEDLKTRRPTYEMEEDEHRPPPLTKRRAKTKHRSSTSSKPNHNVGFGPDNHPNLAPVYPYKPRTSVPPPVDEDECTPWWQEPECAPVTPQRCDLNSQGFETAWTNYCGVSGGFEAPQGFTTYPVTQISPRYACQSCTATCAVENIPPPAPTKGKSWWRFFW